MLKEKKKVKNTTPEEEKIKKWEMIPLKGEDYRNSSYKVFSLGDDILMMSFFLKEVQYFMIRSILAVMSLIVGKTITKAYLIGET